MKKIYTTYGLLLSLTALTACQSDEPGGYNPLTPPEARIEVVGGGPAGLVMQTRTDGSEYNSDNVPNANVPQLAGACSANKLKLLTYHENSLTKDQAGLTPHYSLNNLILEKTKLSNGTSEEVVTLDMPNTFTIGGSSNKWITFPFQYSLKNNNQTYYSIMCLGYNSENENDFELINANVNSKRADLIFSLKDNKTTPDFYYGWTKFYPSEADGTLKYLYPQTNIDDRNGILHFMNNSTSTYNNTADLYGKIYRIVGQFNMTITEVNHEDVEKIELLTNYYPTELQLYGTHGTYYPVTACNDEKKTTGIDGWTVIGSGTPDENDEVHISGYTLPTELGMNLRIKVHFNRTKEELENGLIADQTFNVRPKKAVELDDTHSIYTINSSEVKTNTEHKYLIFNPENVRFYMFSNIRINIKGKLTNIALENVEVQAQIEVEPGYEKEHTFEGK